MTEADPTPSSTPPAGRPYAQIRANTSRDGHVRWIKVDVVDYDWLNDFASWQVILDTGGRPYVLCHKGTEPNKLTFYMARLILGPGSSGRVNYKNGDGLDCRRDNLEWATQSKILAKRKGSGGTSRFKGVAWDAWHGKWVARFRGKNLGRFSDEIAAACAFDDASFAYWGRDAYLNFPERYVSRVKGETPLPIDRDHLEQLGTGEPKGL